jgi:hypothetical protein
MAVERITIGLNRHAVQSNRVNPLYIKYFEQILFCFNRSAIQTEQDLL